MENTYKNCRFYLLMILSKENAFYANDEEVTLGICCKGRIPRVTSSWESCLMRREGKNEKM